MQILHSQYRLKLQYLNLHSHYKPQATNEISIRNAYHFFPKKEILGQYFSAGIHPWHLHKHSLKDIPGIVEPLLSHPKVVAIGEIGLDKLKPNLGLQTAAFLVQTEIAEAAQLPIILHCVRAYPEVLKLIKPKQTIFILHNYYANEQITNSFLKLPNVYFSLGKRYRLAQGSKRGYARIIPAERVFIETDQTREPVEHAYQEIAGHLGISVANLAAFTQSNTQTVFRRIREN